MQENSHLFALCDIFDVLMGLADSGWVASALTDISDVDDLRIHDDFALIPFLNWLLFNSNDVDDRVLMITILRNCKQMNTWLK
jgi:hypothetical protein